MPGRESCQPMPRMARPAHRWLVYLSLFFSVSASSCDGEIPNDVRFAVSESRVADLAVEESVRQ